jgi:predicted oxidoreductase
MQIMQRITISKEGPQFSRIALGFWRLNEWKMNTGQTLDLVEKAIELGITTFDHADIYGGYTCEEMFGKALSEKPSLREKMEIVTKCGICLVSKNRPENQLHGYDTSKKHILQSAETSLKNLSTDYLDVLLIHRPDPLMNAAEIAEAFSMLRESGKVKHFGVSNFSPAQFALLQSRLDFPLVTNQVEVSVLKMDTLHDGTLDQCQQLKISPMAWSPFGGGELFWGNSERIIRLRNELQKIGEELGNVSIDQVALAWLLMHPAKIIPVLGTGNIARIKSAAESLKIELSRDQWFRIWTASAGVEVP